MTMFFINSVLRSGASSGTIPELIGVQTVSAYGSGKTNDSVAKPTGLAEGNRIIIYALFLRSGTVPTITPPLGFELHTEIEGVGDSGSLPYVFQVWTKIATSDDVIVSSFEFTHEECSSSLACTAWDNATYISDKLSSESTTVTSTIPGFIPRQGKLRVLSGTQNWSDVAATTPSGMTALDDNGIISTFHEQRDAANVAISPRDFANNGGSGNPSKTILVYMSSVPILPLINLSSYGNASNTGYRTSLTPSSSVTTTEDGQIIANLDITGFISVEHNNVTIRDCNINMTSEFWGIISGNNTTIEYCTIVTDAGGAQGSAGILMDTGGTIQYCDISGVENGILGGGSGINILNNYIHDLASVAVEPHFDGIQSTGSISNLTIRGNTILSQDTSNIILQNEDGPYSGFVIIEGNYFDGIVAAPIYLRGDKSAELWDAEATVERNIFVFTDNGILDLTSGPEIVNWINNMNEDGSIIAAY